MDNFVKVTKAEFESMPKEVEHQALVFIEFDDYVLVDYTVMTLPYYSWVHEYLDGKEVVQYSRKTE